MFGFRLPTRLHVEPGALERLPEAARAHDLRRVLLVTDAGLRAIGEPIERATALLHSTGIDVEIFDEVEANPRTTTATRLADRLRDGGRDGFVAVGGGSVLDAAKAAAMLARNELRIEQYEGKNRYAEDPAPLIAVPTTAGTGSEVTQVAVLTLEATRSKMSIKGETMFPDHALVDGELLATLPAGLLAATGADALTHAIEASLSTASNEISSALAGEAVRLLFTHLPPLVEATEDQTNAATESHLAAHRAAVARASTLAGMAFGNADVGAVHCLSETLGGLYDLPHGETNAALLVPVLRAHRPVVPTELARLDRAVFAGGAPTALAERSEREERADHFVDAVASLLSALPLRPFSALGVPAEDFDQIASRAVQNGSNRTNPQPMSPARYRAVLDDAA